MKKDNSLIGAAGVFYVSCIFSMRDMIALPTIKNTAGYDIIVTSRDGTKHANVQVKTSDTFVKFWPVCQKVSSVKTSDNDFYVLLRRTKDKDGLYEGFMVTGLEMKAELEADIAYRQKRGQKVEGFLLCASIGDDEKSKLWRERWLKWTL